MNKEPIASQGLRYWFWTLMVAALNSVFRYDGNTVYIIPRTKAGLTPWLRMILRCQPATNWAVKGVGTP